MLGEIGQRWFACFGRDSTAPWTFALEDLWLGLGLVLGGFIALSVGRRLMTGLATLRAVAFVPFFSRSLSKWVKSRDYSNEEFFRADGAEEKWIPSRKQALTRLATYFQAHHTRSIAWGNSIRESFSDLRFTDANRVPFPFMRVVREKFNLCSVVTASDGPKLRDLDEHWTLDVSGSYGVNVAGFDRYKEWLQKGWEHVKDLGPVLGPLHPLVADNVAMLKSISKLDEVSFHMSGTEAVMAAVRLARFNTRKKLIVCFSGAYHGWWDGVQPGLGSERDLSDCLTLKDMHPASLNVLRRRAKEIAGVLVNPVQSFHPNSPPPSDAVLLTSAVRDAVGKTQDAHAPYTDWLRQLREVCTANDIPLILDEVYTGFRLAPGGAQECFGIQADMVVYGKTVAGGMPIGAVCGTAALMQRFDPAHPMRIAYVIGTFSAHPLVMGTMYEFLRWVIQPTTATLYAQAARQCSQWVQETNRKIADAGLPVRVVHLVTVWTVLFQEPSRYNWLLQYYLRAEGLTLSWVGTGRCLSSLDFTREDYKELQAKLFTAALKMKRDGWWLSEHEQPGKEKRMRSRLVREMLGSLIQVPRPIKSFYVEVMQRKKDDHVASHSNAVNQFFHILSSGVFLYCYVLLLSDLTTAVCWSLAALLVRQAGHALIEPPCHDKEAPLLGFNTHKKSLIVSGYVLIPVLHMGYAGDWTLTLLTAQIATIAQHWFVLTLLVVAGRVAYLIWAYDLRISMIWFIKLITDPLTDIMAYSPRYLNTCQALLPPHLRWSRNQ